MSDGERPMSDAERALTALLGLMARLRDPERGCPWDREQTFATIAPYTIEEAYEVADAIERDDREHLREELGDLLFQVVFHARLAQERGWFDFAAVANSIHEKLVRRHPHLFAGASLAAQDLVRVWEQQKAQERAAAAGRPGGAGSTVLAGVPQALPALTRATKLGRRAARVGFDWSEAQQVRAKVLEELAEIDAASAAAGTAGAEPAGHSGAALAEELGDLLFAIANWSRHLHIDAEQALRGANGKFERRFSRMERLARERDLQLESLSAAEWDALWREAKLNRT
jgi:nucleoside triphosphate diphosphatase